MTTSQRGDGQKERYDILEIYCRRLGHPVPFRYCRSTVEARPCARIADCWFERFDVTSYLREQLSADELARLDAPPPAKIVSLVDLIEAARQRVGSSQSNG